MSLLQSQSRCLRVIHTVSDCDSSNDNNDDDKRFVGFVVAVGDLI